MSLKTFCITQFIAAVFLVLPAFRADASIEGTAHDLSAAGTGRGNPCSFCHTPHGAISGTPLWNHALSETTYRIYQSSSLAANLSQPTGSSKLCLSCHDGTVALTRTIRGGTDGAYIRPGSANLGTDLSDDHPISFVYSLALSWRMFRYARLQHCRKNSGLTGRESCNALPVIILIIINTANLW